MRSVVMSTDAWAGCLTHALSTESEEIMGVLFGEVVEEEQSPGKSTRANGTKSSANSVDCTVLVYSFKTLVRSDRRKDRVEVSSLQLSAALHSVEQDKKELLRSNMKIVGWYHSHPHITVLPSHVDLRSQLKYQELDSTWVGLIFSVFSSGFVCARLLASDCLVQKVKKAASPGSVLALLIDGVDFLFVNVL